jgi:hypothetical protein
METKKAFNQLAYQLIYPAVLGSIIFDLADPFRHFSQLRVIGFLICLCFIIDYLHMTLNLCKDGTSPLKYGAVMDIVIAIFFCLSYFSISKATIPDVQPLELEKYLQYSLGYIAVAQILIIIYEIPLKKGSSISKVDYMPLCISGIGLSAIFFIPVNLSIHIVTITIFFIFISYTYRVIETSRQPKRDLIS